jgi:hypothetical protein
VWTPRGGRRTRARAKRCAECKPEWYVIPAEKGSRNDPTRPVTTLRTAWTKVRDKAKVVGRWHDNRYTLVTEISESGAGDEVVMSIAGHVSRAMLSRYSHVPNGGRLLGEATEAAGSSNCNSMIRIQNRPKRRR